MKCAQCEDAKASVWCVDEDLQFCAPCSLQLHSKKARQHHEVVSVNEALLCAECEDASAEVECFACGGHKLPLVFCLDCSSKLHSRAARAGHHVNRIGRLRKRGRENYFLGKIVVDLTASDSEDEGPVVTQSNARSVSSLSSVGQGSVKQEEISVNDAAKPSLTTFKDRDTSASDKASTTIDKRRLPSGRVQKVQKKSGQQVKVSPEKNKFVRELRSRSGMRDTAPANRLETSSTIRNHPDSAIEENSSASDSSSDSDYNESEDEQDGVRRIKRGSVSLEAFVVDADTQGDDDSPEAPPNGNVESGIKKRIKNMLELGLHPDTPEYEAQQALKNAQRMLTKHNLQQAEVLNGNLTNTTSLTGGMRVVELRTKGKTKTGRMETWIRELLWLIGDNFDCQHYFRAASKTQPLRFVFYGISSNADCAGYAFAATFNRITAMSAAYVADENFDDDKENEDLKLQKINQGIYTRVARTNYRKGIVTGLKEAVKSAQRGTQSASEFGRNVPDPPTRYESEAFSSDSNGEDSPTPCSPDAGREDDGPVTPKAERCMAITALMMHSKKVGEDFLKQKGIKVQKRTVRSRLAAWNAQAFVQGKRDSESIDINQRSITNSKVTKRRNRAENCCH